MDLSKLKLNLRQKASDIDPIRIFGGLTQRGQVETLYGPQQEALIRWHQKHRTKTDVLFAMATGGGKTLVGLLAAQSLVNELHGQVVYVCSTNQLVEQTAAQAQDCGIQVATYAKGQWTNNQGYESATCCCITNYHALFNGRSRFLNDSIKAVLFDDAHVAPAIIRDCFTIKIPYKHEAWELLMRVLHKHFSSSPFVTRFTRFRNRMGRYDEGILFVPSWFIWSERNRIAEILEGADIHEGDTGFAYPHLRDHLSECAWLLGSNGTVEITPTVLPTHALPYFSTDVRRIYLTATLPTRYECIRTFGVDRADVICPSGKMGAAQRLFLFAESLSDQDPYEHTRDLIDNYKACVITPSRPSAKKWEDIGTVYDSKQGHSSITEFAEADDNRKMILAGLFDGIDLPGKACKILVLDGLPRGGNLHDRFVEEHLDAKRLRIALVAGRITQAVGRIFRSNTDHGVVVLADKSIQSWLRSPEHLCYLPELLQQQIRLGDAIRGAFSPEEKASEYVGLMQKVIEGAPEWDSFYNSQLAQIASEKRTKEPTWADVTARKEYDAWREAWEGRYAAAAEKLVDLGDELLSVDHSLAAWQFHWAGLCYLQAEDNNSAQVAFERAANIKTVLRRPSAELKQAGAEYFANIVTSPQAQRASRASVESEKVVNAVLVKLLGDGGMNAEDHEQGLKELGLLLGLKAERPDKDEGKGPDVLWTDPDSNNAVGMEAKTQKESPEAYKKNKHIGKVHNDREWMQKRFGNTPTQIWIVGPIRPVVAQASPPEDLRIVPIEGLIELAERLLSAARRIALRPAGTPLEKGVQEAFNRHGLLWPDVVESIESCLATDLQQDDVFDPD